MTDADRALAQLIEQCEPATLAAFGERGQQLAERWRQQHEQCELTRLDAEQARRGLSLPSVQDLALVTDSLEHLGHSEGQTLIGQLRNYGTRQIAVLVADKHGWSLSDFIGLGFRRQARFEEGDQPLSLYTYNIASYNHRRTWNNPQYWANPEMWDKARW